MRKVKVVVWKVFQELLIDLSHGVKEAAGRHELHVCEVEVCDRVGMMKGEWVVMHECV